MTRLRTAGQGLALYANENRDVLVPGRLPGIDDDHWRIKVVGGVKYRPSFLTMMESQVGIPPFDEPLANRTLVDKHGQPGDRQNYASEQFVCPEVPDWVDERNGAYGYNYQFLGNSRLRDESVATSYKNWPVKSSQVRTPAACVAVADSMGTAASFPVHERGVYEDNAFGDSRSGRSHNAFGNEGFNLDPPWVSVAYGEMAGLDEGERTAVHPRHNGKGMVLWMDGHASAESLDALGYRLEPETGVVNHEGYNKYFNIDGKDLPWVSDLRDLEHIEVPDRGGR
jgi:prepilin-type processing-associated H-X9-DG protein